MEQSTSQPAPHQWYSFFLQGYRPFLLIALLIVLVYARTITYDFVKLDDDYLVQINYPYLSDWHNLPSAFQQDAFHSKMTFFYRPMLTISFMIDARWAGPAPAGYHISNILYHMVACWLVFYLLQLLRYSSLASLLLALVFAIHPVQTQAIAWLPGRNDILLAIFILTSFSCFIHYLRSGKISWIALHMICFTLALFTKEPALALPFFCIIYFLIQPARLSKWKIAGITGTWLCISACWLMLRQRYIAQSTEPLPAFFNTPAEIITGYLSYAGKLLFPTSLSPFLIPKDVRVTEAMIAALFFIILFFMSGIRARRMFLLGMLWLFIFLLPGNLFHFIDGAAFMEHRMYLPMVGVMLMLAELKWMASLSTDNKKQPLIIGLTIVFFGAITVIYTPTFKDAFNFWKHITQRAPDFYMGHHNLGYEYMLRGQLPEAAQELQKAIQNNPQFARSYNQMGILMLNRDNIPQAEYYFHEALRIDPYFPEVLTNLGTIESKRSNHKKAISLYLQAIRIQPDFTSAYYNLAVAYKSAGRLDSAIYYLNRVVHSTRPRNDFSVPADFTESCYTLLGYLYIDLNNYQAAIEQFGRALEINPHYAKAYKGLALAYYQLHDEAKADYYKSKAQELGQN